MMVCRRAARRECEEEVGLHPQRVERVGAFYPTPGYCDELMVFFRLTGLTALRTVLGLRLV